MRRSLALAVAILAVVSAFGDTAIVDWRFDALLSIAKDTSRKYTTDSETLLELPGDSKGFLPPEGRRAAFTHGLRVNAIGEKPLQLTLAMHARERDFAIALTTEANSNTAHFEVTGRGIETPVKLEVPRSAFPADIVVDITFGGEWTLRVRKPDKSVIAATSGRSTIFDGYWIDGYGIEPVKLETVLKPIESGTTVELEVGRHYVGYSSRPKKINAPAIVKPAREFDPVKAGWPLVFSDEFDGNEVDWSKWFFVVKAGKPEFGEHVLLDGQGHLKLETTYGRVETNELDAVSLRTKQEFVYGYYEARCKLTKENGWWAAFWLLGRDNSDPFADGFEIDVFEDYYTRKIRPDGEKRRQFDHNLHFYFGRQLKSWNYSSEFEGDFDDWFTIGVKRTPFEISYYLNGKLIPAGCEHSDWAGVVFDAFNFGTGNAPLCLILSQQRMHKGNTYFDKTNAKFPEYFNVDYVRAYEMPRSAEILPEVSWKEPAAKLAKDGLKFYTPGEKYRLGVNAKSAASTGAKLKAAFLFDSGYMVAYKTEPPYDFEVTMTPEFFADTSYMRPGRQRKPIDFTTTPHSFVVFVQDETGAVNSTPVIRRYPRYSPEKLKAPEGWQVRNIPGKAIFKVSSCSMWGDTFNCEIEVAEVGEYQLAFNWGTCVPGRHENLILLDGEILTQFTVTREDERGIWAPDRVEKLGTFKLPAGRHLITIATLGQLVPGDLVISRSND